MKYLFSLFAISSYCVLNANNLFIDRTVDCVEFANAVEGQDGDSGDFETWSIAFEHCANQQGYKTVVIKG